MYDKTLTKKWNDAYREGAEAHPMASNPYSKAQQMEQFAAFAAGKYDQAMGYIKNASKEK